jgi:hypothetical protein
MELRILLPLRLADLTPKQLTFVSRLFLSNIPEPEFLAKAALYFAGLKLQAFRDPEPDGARWYRHGSLKKPFIVTAEIIVQMAERCRFLLQPDEVKPMPWIRMARARHYRLYNASFDEYLMAENYYFAYTKTKDPAHLDNLIAVLYRRPWHRWSSSRIQTRAKIFRSVDPAVKNTVFMWYIGFRTYIPKRCTNLFSGEKSDRPFQPREYINGMIHQLSNGDITLKKQLLRQPALDALDELEQRALEYKQITKKK